LVALVAAGIVFCFAGPSLAAKRRVLLVSSYHPGFPTFFQQIDGLKSELAPAGVALDVEFMDSKRFYTPESRKLFHDTLAYKLANLPRYDVVVTSDDNALRFALDHRAELFPDTPVVFCGVNDLQLAHSLEGSEGFTGVEEAVSLTETLEAMRKLLPQVAAIYAVTDRRERAGGPGLYRRLGGAFAGRGVGAVLQDATGRTGRPGWASSRGQRAPPASAYRKGSSSRTFERACT
jgi:ABC-type uncharacterized transport system substrate-binding protein